MTHDANTTSAYTIASMVEYILFSKASMLWSLALSVTVLVLISLSGAVPFVAISWNKIPLWRQFKNYILLNLVISMFVMNAAYTGCFADWPCCSTILIFIYTLSMAAFSNWVLIVCLVISTKSLKVCSSILHHKYYKANALAWGLAILESTFSLYAKLTTNDSHIFPEDYDYLFICTCSCDIVLLMSYLSIKSNREIWQDYLNGKDDADYQDCNINLK